MRVQDVMSDSVKTISPSTAAGEAWDLMQRNGFHHLVVMRGGQVAGVVSQRDLGGRHGAALRARGTVEDLMTARVVTVAPTVTVRKAANLMRGHSIGCLVVVAGGRVAGIVTVADLLDLLGHGVDRPAPAPRRGLSHRVPHRKQATSAAAW